MNIPGKESTFVFMPCGVEHNTRSYHIAELRKYCCCVGFVFPNIHMVRASFNILPPESGDMGLFWKEA